MPPVVDPVQAGREALGRHAWQEAFDQLSQADRDGELSGSDLEALASAAFFVARAGDELALKERAFKAYETAGDQRARRLSRDRSGSDVRLRGQAVDRLGLGPSRRADRRRRRRHVRPRVPRPRSERGGARPGDIETALALAERGRRRSANSAANADLKAYAQSNLGALKIASGETTDGIALMEEASIAAVNGELSPFTTGVTACRMIGACRDLTDYRRASEWIEATERYCDRQSLSGFPGVCRVHRAEVAAVGGAWEQRRSGARAGDRRARRVQRRRPAGRRVLRDRRHPPPARRLRGRRVGAARGPRAGSIAAAGARPHPPGRGQDQGRVGRDRRRRGRGDLGPLGAGAPPAGAGRDRDRGRRRRAGADRRRRARRRSSRATRRRRSKRVARSRSAGSSLAEGDAGGGRSRAPRRRSGLARGRRAVRGRPRAGGPRTRAAGARRRGRRRPRAARRTGRVPAASGPGSTSRRPSASCATSRIVGPGPRPRTRRSCSPTSSARRTLAEALGDAGLGAAPALARRHAPRAMVASGGGEIVNSTGDGFFAAFESARAGVDCAIAIQRALRRAPGQHAASPSRSGSACTRPRRTGAATDYSGKGVHVAARVAALAEGGEILATADDARRGRARAGLGGTRETPIRGVGEPMQVATVAWD